MTDAEREPSVAGPADRWVVWRICCGPASRPLEEAMTEEMRRLQGTWVQPAWAKDGVPGRPDEPGGEPRVTFVGDTFVVTLVDGGTPIKGTFALDPTREPKAVDWTDTFGEDAGKTFPAIYRLEG